MNLKRILRIPKSIYIRIKRQQFRKSFLSIAPTAEFGFYGYGDGCQIEGKQNIEVGDHAWFGKGSEILAYDSHFSEGLKSHLTIGDDVRANSRCRITCAGNITIGDHVLMAPDVFITDHNHGMDPLEPQGYSKQPLIIKDVVIGDGVWLGQRVCVLPGVTIGEHSIIGANSVVTHDIPAYSIAVGAPARVVKQWNDSEKCWERV